MKKTGLFQAMKMCKNYGKLDEKAREQLRKERFRDLVAYARENSPFYAHLYTDVQEEPDLTMLPPVTKAQLMEHWDEWLTDRCVSLDDVMKFMEDRNNLGRKFRGKYQVYTTSGSTGNPLVMLCDSQTANITNGMSFCRAYARKEDMKAFISGGGRSIGVYADSGFYLGNGSIHAKLRAFPWKKKQIGLVDALLPTADIVKRLNEFNPVMLGGYPSNLELLIEEQQQGRLHIAPVIIMTGGEYLSPTLRKQLSVTFHCYVQTSYACTEGGTMACECREQHLHVNDDWLLIEPVNREGKPVPEGELADRILITNFANYTQPLIRYEVTDRIIMHHEPCSCGNSSPWLEVEGRTDEVTTFVQDDKKIRIAPLAMYAALKEVHSLKRFQVEVRENNQMIMRLIPVEGTDKNTAFQEAKLAVGTFLSTQGVKEFTCELAPEEPAANPKNGKYKHIVRG